jgi:undecaprenyl-diphosphatase
LLSQRRWLLISSALVVLVLLIGYSRMFFGFHYVSDVVGGYIAGIFWLSLCLSIYQLLPLSLQPEHAEEAST